MKYAFLTFLIFFAIHSFATSIAVATDDYTMTSEDVILFDLDQTGGTITFPACSDGREVLLSPKNSSGSGAASFDAQPGGTDSFDSSLGSPPITLGQWSKFSAICYQTVWYQR